MQNQHLQPEETPQSGWNRGRIDADTQTDLIPSSTTGAEMHPEAEDKGEQQHMEEGTVFPSPGMAMTEHKTLLDRLIRQAHKQKRWRRISVGFYYTGICVYLIYSLLGQFGRLHSLPSYFPLMLVLFYGSALVAEIVTRYRWSRSTADITKIDDVHAVGTLAEAMDIPDKGILAQAEAALTRLLPRLKASDAHLLNEGQRRCLYQRLKIEYALTRPDFLVVLLEALEKVGDAAALPAVQALTTSTVTTANGKRVKAAAQKCLPLLRLRVRTQETSNTLLRASSAEDTTGSALLRPAQGGNDTAPEQLLRASDSDSKLPF